MVTLYIHMGKLRNSFYEIKYTETFSVQMTHKNSQNDDNGNFITLMQSEEGIHGRAIWKCMEDLLIRTIFPQNYAFQFSSTL